MSALADAVAPNQVRNYDQFWIAPDGIAYRVKDHLAAAQRVKAESDDYERVSPWGYQDMFKRAWLRAHIQEDTMYIDGNPPNPAQQRWIKDVKAYMTRPNMPFRVTQGLAQRQSPSIPSPEASAEITKAMDRQTMPPIYKGRLGDSNNPTRRFLDAILNEKKAAGPGA